MYFLKGIGVVLLAGALAIAFYFIFIKIGAFVSRLLNGTSKSDVAEVKAAQKKLKSDIEAEKEAVNNRLRELQEIEREDEEENEWKKK